MEADFMERQALSRNSIFLAFALFLASCTTQTNNKYSAVKNSALEKKSWQNGILYIENRPFTGTLYTLYPGTKDTADISNFWDGREHGIRKVFYPNGNPANRREFYRGGKTGTYIAWWENGQKKLQYVFKNDEYEGICREWNADGILTKEMTYRKGHEEGSQKMFYETGKVRSNYVVINGRRFGLLGTKNCVNVSDKIFKN